MGAILGTLLKRSKRRSSDDKQDKRREDAKLREGTNRAPGSNTAGPRVLQGTVGTSLLSEQSFPNPFGTRR